MGVAATCRPVSRRCAMVHAAVLRALDVRTPHCQKTAKTHPASGSRKASTNGAALRTPASEVRARAERWSRALAEHGVTCDVVDLSAVAGGGAFAEESFASAGVALRGDAEALLARLRRGEPPVVARIEGDRVVVDARTVLPDEDELLLRAIIAASRAETA